MSKNKLLPIFSISTLIVFLLSAVFSIPVLADSGSTTPSAAPSSGGRTSNKGSSNSLSQVPSGTKVVVLDSSGDKVPLGSQASADIVASGDPIWCPSTVSAPVAGLSGCSPALYNSDLYTLTNAVESDTWHPTVTNSTIWILGGSSSPASQIVLNDAILTSLGNFSLTFKGGWTGSGGAINNSVPSTINGAGLSIVWNNNVAMSNIVVSNAPGVEDGIYIYTPKNISLTNVEAGYGHSYGAYLDTTSGNGTVTITNSHFIGNDITYGNWGLDVLSHGAITLTGVTADYNYASGANLDNCEWNGSTACNNLTSAPITITSSDFSTNNTGPFDGLQVDSTGVIKLTDVTATGNGALGTGDGASLDNCNSNGSTCTTYSQALTMTGTNIFDSNQGAGLDVNSGGAITSGSLDANSNGGVGADITNNHVVKATPITLSGTSSFSGNGNAGLEVYSQGAITVNNLSADDNSGSGEFGGAFLNNVSKFDALITVTGTNWFSDRE